MERARQVQTASDRGITNIDVRVGPEAGGRLTTDEVRSFIELFYRGATDTQWTVSFIGSDRNRDLLGQHMWTGAGHSIRIFVNSIACRVGRSPVGGNCNVPKTLRTAAFMVLRHEIQHANQHVWHSSGTGFWRGRYRSRDCEIDARRSVDADIGEICAFLGEAEPPMRLLSAAGYAEDLQTLADDLEPAGSLTVQEVRDELRIVGLNNSICLEMLIQMLAERGCEVK